MIYQTYSKARELLERSQDLERAEILLRPPEKDIEYSYRNRASALASVLKEDLKYTKNDGFELIHQRVISKIVEFAYQEIIKEKELIKIEFENL